MAPLRHRRAGGLAAVVVVLALAGLAGCGGDDEETGSEFCNARDDLAAAVDELQGFQLASDDDVPEAKELVGNVIDRLRDMLTAAPDEITAAAETMSVGLDDIERQVEEADAIELGTQVPALLARIGGSGDAATAAAVAEVNSYAQDTCD